MPTARSLNGWLALLPSSLFLATGTVPGTEVRLRMRREVLPLFLALAADYHRAVAPLRKGECGAHNYRPAMGGGGWSDHASGTAVDLNWRHEGAQGPHGGMATMSKAQVAACAALKRKYRILIWGGDKARGGDYAKPVNWDPMHFAIAPGVSPAEVAKVIAALRIRDDGTIAPVPAKPSKGWATITDPDGAPARRKPSTTAPVRFHRAKGYRFRYVAVVKGDGHTWLRTRFGNHYRADKTSRGA